MLVGFPFSNSTLSQTGTTVTKHASFRKLIVNSNRQFQLLVYVCKGEGGGGVRYHIADYAEKIKMVAA